MRKRGNALLFPVDLQRTRIIVDNRSWAQANTNEYLWRGSTIRLDFESRVEESAGGESGSRIVTRARQDAREPTFPLFCGMRVRFFTASCRLYRRLYARDQPRCAKETHRLLLQGPANTVARIITHNRGISWLTNLGNRAKKEKELFKKKSGKNLKIMDGFCPRNSVNNSEISEGGRRL